MMQDLKKNGDGNLQLITLQKIIHNCHLVKNVGNKVLIKTSRGTPGSNGYVARQFHRQYRNVLPAEHKAMNGTRVMNFFKVQQVNNLTRTEAKAVNGDTNKIVAGTKSGKRLAAQLGWDSDNDDDDDVIVEYQHCPRRVLGIQDDSETDEFITYQCNLPVPQICSNLKPQDNEIKSNLLYSACESEDTNVSQKENATPVIERNNETDLILSDVLPKSLRCYHKKKSKVVDKILEGTSSQLENVPCASSKLVEVDLIGKKKPDESPLIMPKKTNDITKIKGWRRKQFFVEKPTTVEFYRLEKGSISGLKGANSRDKEIRLEKIDVRADEQNDSNTLDHAFVCDDLDSFLDKEAELKINYEIPHLYAEIGIKLTSEDVVSRPNLTENEVVEVGRRYCLDLPHNKEEALLDYPLIDTKDLEEEKVEYYKVVKIDKNKRRIIKIEQRQEQSKGSVTKSEKQRKQETFKKEFLCGTSVEESNLTREVTPVKLLRNMFLTSKLIGVVVYPGVRPLHPLVKNHLDKLRSFRTNIDRNWANFAAAAVHVKRSPTLQFHRRILPVYCTGKTDRKVLLTKEAVPNEEAEVNVVSVPFDENQKPQGESAVVSKNRAELTRTETHTSPKLNRSKVPNWSGSYLKDCRVVIERLLPDKNVRIWCMEHSRYQCSLCGFQSERPQIDVGDPFMDAFDVSQLCVTEIGTEGHETSLVPEVIDPAKSSFQEVKNLHPVTRQTAKKMKRALFNKRLNSLLAKKLRDVAFCDEILINIDKLKTLVPNGLELIKLNYVKQSFLTGYIHLWYLKAQVEKGRCRAFLTFADDLPEPNAVRINRTENIPIGMPKVINELATPEKVFDNAEYAILHCNGKTWEIHGSLNIAVDNGRVRGKNTPAAMVEHGREIEQIFIPVPLSEMVDIRKIATTILMVKATKWWVLDLSHKFGEMVLQILAQNTVITRRHLLNVIKSGFSGFLAMRKSKGRLYGTYILNSLLPFVLIGPYYTFETCSVSVRMTTSATPLPFVYNESQTQMASTSLRFFINSVIAAQEGDRKLDGLWLYDKEGVENACYLETITSDTVYSLPRTDYAVETEHGYGMNSLTSHTNPTNPLRLNGSDGSVDVRVYLYFSIFDLGYLTGQLQEDNSIVISHPLSPDTKMKSHNLGNLFVSLLKRRVQFIPDNLSPQWFITRHKEDLGLRTPFNKFILDGTHVLCKNGLLSLLRITEATISHLGLAKHQVLNAIANSPVIREVTALKDLKALLTKDSTTNTPMQQVLQMATKIIKELQKADGELTKTKKKVEAQKLGLWEKYVKLINHADKSDEEKIGLLFNVIRRRRYKNSELNEHIVEILKKHEFGRNFLTRLEGNRTQIKKGTENKAHTQLKTVKETNTSREVRIKNGMKQLQKTSVKTDTNLKSRVGNPIRKRPTAQKTSEGALIKRLESRLFKVCETIDTSGNTTGVKEQRRLIRKLNAISNQINAIKTYRDTGKRGKTTSLTIRERVMRLKRVRRSRPKEEKAKGKENEANDEKKVKESMSVPEVPENEISVLKVVKTSAKSSSRQGNGKILQSSGKTNGNRTPDKKVFIIQGNRKWSLQRVNVNQT
ncbi:hypothetical protein RUM44_007679 [Polyplax serrata]|uniref:Uncharacterized protein n=1 Tax=Polyplax serrata TaxID=468196 RepID=A0ABR1B727_POLSC